MFPPFPKRTKFLIWCFWEGFILVIMVYTKLKFKSPFEKDFPEVDIEQDASLSIEEILYNVSHGLPTGLNAPILDYDESDEIPEDINLGDDKFETIDALTNVADVVETDKAELSKQDGTKEDLSERAQASEGSSSEV